MRKECTRRLGTWRTSYIEIKPEDIGKDNKICKDAKVTETVDESEYPF